MAKYITLPLTEEQILELNAGDIVFLSGEVYTARDAAHKRIVETIKSRQNPPFEIKDSAIYYAGPTPAKPGMAIGSCGPTSSSRMDDYTPFLLEKGLKVMIGKGKRSQSVIDSMKKHKAVYLCAVGGAAALATKYIKSSQTIAYEDLGTEAVRKLQIKDFPLIVAIDAKGNSLFDR
ncbi:MAG TPA: Fe-S-containing hydro-lyase [Clostridia bacterium]